MSDITEAFDRTGNALSAWREDPSHAPQHLEAALRATGDLQRALILEQINTDPLRAAAAPRSER